MKKIITITLNPAFDLHYMMDRFEPEKENYVNSIICDAGGKGINTSRALMANGVKNTAYVVVGSDNADQFERALKHDGVNFVPLRTKGRIRENITLHPSNYKETRISFDNFSIDIKTLESLYEMLYKSIDFNTLVSFAGRLPKGISKDAVKEFIKDIMRLGAKVAIDSNSFEPVDYMDLRPWFIKPNEQEIVAFVGREVKRLDDACFTARELVEKGMAEQIMISMGSLGSVWSDGFKTHVVSTPKIEAPISTIGAGDSTIAGFLAGSAENMPIENTLRLACAYGTAACLTPGTRPPIANDVKFLYKRVSIK